MSKPQIVLPEVAEEKLKEWPFTEDPTQAISDKLVRVDENERRWLVLYEFILAESNYAEPRAWRPRQTIRRVQILLLCVCEGKGKPLTSQNILAAEASLRC